MVESTVYRAEEVMEKMQCSKSVAYKIIRDINRELKQQGKIIVAGRVNKRIFEEKTGCMA